MTNDPDDLLLPYRDWCKTVEAGDLRDKVEQRPEFKSNRVISRRIFTRILTEVRCPS